MSQSGETEQRFCHCPCRAKLLTTYWIGFPPAFKLLLHYLYKFQVEQGIMAKDETAIFL